MYPVKADVPSVLAAINNPAVRPVMLELFVSVVPIWVPS